MSDYINYKDLMVWQKSRKLVCDIYQLTRYFPREELFGLTNQIRRAAVSIPSNIAEGYNRGSDREVIRFLQIAKGSAAEVETQTLISMDLGYVGRGDVIEILRTDDEIIRMLSTLIRNKRMKIQQERG